MFFEPIKKNHGLPKNPFISLVLPRPIGWITSRDAEGVVNLAPYSFFNVVCYRPPTVVCLWSRERRGWAEGYAAQRRSNRRIRL